MRALNTFLFLQTILLFMTLTLTQHVDRNICVTVPNGVNEDCVMGNFFPLPSIKTYSSHSSFFNFCLNTRVETTFVYNASLAYCYDVLTYESCNETQNSGDSNYCNLNICDINSACYCVSGSMSDNHKCVINGVSSPLVLHSDVPGGIILHSTTLLNTFYLNDVDPPSVIKTLQGFIVSYDYPFRILLSTKRGNTFISSGNKNRMYYQFEPDVLKTNFHYTGLILDSNNQSIGAFAHNHTAFASCEEYRENPCYLCQSSFTEFSCKDLEDKIVTILIMISLLILVILSFIFIMFLIFFLTKIFLKCFRPAKDKLMRMHITKKIQTSFGKVCRKVKTCFSDTPNRSVILPMYASYVTAQNTDSALPMKIINADHVLTFALVISLCIFLFIKQFKEWYKPSPDQSEAGLEDLKVKFRKVKKSHKNKSLECRILFSLLIISLFFPIRAQACDDGASFTGSVTNCDNNGVCRISASSSGIVNFIGQETCLNFLDNNNNGLMQLKFEVLSITFDLIYSLVYYTGDRIVVGYTQSHCIGIGHCPSNCNSTSYPDRTNNGMFNSPYIPITKGELTCHRYDISGFCPFPGDDCQYCGYYILPQGEPYRVYEYNSASIPKIFTKLYFISSGYTSEAYVYFTKGVDQIVCFSTVCFTINLQTESEYSFDPFIQYSTYPNFFTGSSDIFSLPGLPVVNKIGDIQSNSPTPWSATDYANIIYTQTIVDMQPTIDGCSTSTVSSRLETNNAVLPFYHSGIYYEPISLENFSGIRAHKANTTSVLYSISTTSNSTITRVVNSNMFTIQGNPTPTFSGCCDCIGGGLFCFEAVMSDVSGTGVVESDSIDFLDPIFRNGQNCLSFITEHCDMSNHEFHFSTNSMSLTYEFDVVLNNVDISTFSSIRYTTVVALTSEVSSFHDNNQDVGHFLKNMLGFKDNDLSKIFSSIFYSLLGLCICLVLTFCCVQCTLRVIKQKTN